MNKAKKEKMRRMVSSITLAGVLIFGFAYAIFGVSHDVVIIEYEHSGIITDIEIANSGALGSAPWQRTSNTSMHIILDNGRDSVILKYLNTQFSLGDNVYIRLSGAEGRIPSIKEWEIY